MPNIKPSLNQGNLPQISFTW